MAEKSHDFDPAEMLGSDEAIEAFLAEAPATSDAKFIASALGRGSLSEPDCTTWPGRKAG